MSLVNAPSSKHPVLIVDDDVATVEILAHVLEDECFAVAKAHSAAEARAAIARQCPDLILLDVMLPDGDGRNLCHEFKSAEPTRDVFVILISGMAIGPQSRISGLNLGADEYLTKPVQPAEIVARIRSCLRIREAADALRRANERLEERVLARTEELWLANQELQLAAAASRALSSRLLETQERERRRLAHELHDEAGQALTVLKFSFDSIEELAAPGAPEAMAEGRAALTRLT
ncbi:MAG: response regulator [Limisphaerales bacterium]